MIGGGLWASNIYFSSKGKEEEAAFIQSEVITVTSVSNSIEGYRCYSIHT